MVPWLEIHETLTTQENYLNMIALKLTEVM